jgi:hypothetical protein
MGRTPEPSDDEKHATTTYVSRAVEDVDTAAELASGEQGVLDPGEALRVRFEIHRSGVDSNKHIIPCADARSTSIFSH